MLTSQQLRAARALVEWSGRELAKHSGVSYASVQRLEASKGSLTGLSETRDKLQIALEAAGVRFIPQDEHGGPGVRLKNHVLPFSVDTLSD